MKINFLWKNMVMIKNHFFFVSQRCICKKTQTNSIVAKEKKIIYRISMSDTLEHSSPAKRARLEFSEITNGDNKKEGTNDVTKSTMEKKAKKIMYAIILTGRRETSSAHEDWPTNGSNQCSRIQKAVGGNFEGLVITNSLECYVNEEGLIKQLPQNEAAAYALDHLGFRIPFPGLVWGPAVLLFRKKDKYTAFKKDWFDLYLENNLPDDQDGEVDIISDVENADESDHSDVEHPDVENVEGNLQEAGKKEILSSIDVTVS
jgi:hypothetical protein